MTSISGYNNPNELTSFTDIVKDAVRNYWQGSPTVDSDGWPTSGAFDYVFQESLNQGLDVDPLMLGTIYFEFDGSATISLFGNCNYGSLSYSYNAGTNKTTGTFTTQNRGINSSSINFTSALRDGVSTPGITNFKMMRPVSPGSSTTYATDTVFTAHVIDAMSYFDVIRFQYVSNQQRTWAERTKPSYFNQRGGTRSSPYYAFEYANISDNGWSWEYKVALCNATNCHLMISIPPNATDNYVTNLANLIRYGSDGTTPYTSVQESPVFAPLDADLKVYFEIGNELWNSAASFYNDFQNIVYSTIAVADAAGDDFDAINYDGLSTAKDGNGNYVSLGTWKFRYIMLRTMQMSDIFRTVFGDDAMPGTSADPRIRPMYEWQYANVNSTAELALTWADRYFNKTDPASTYSGDATPLTHWIYSGGGAAYYGAVDGNGRTTLIGDSGFENTLVAAGYNQAPSGSSWTFDNTSGIGRYSNGSDGIPSPYAGQQLGYITGISGITTSFTVPSSQTSDLYAVAFRAHNRRSSGVTHTQNLRVYLDYGTVNQADITATTFSQANGYVPPSIEEITPWKARNVYWTESEYYYTKSRALTAGSTHTITIRGTVAGQTAFLDDVRITSVDAIFASGMPGGGEATGQPAGSNIQSTMQVSAAWAKAFGLDVVAYESGWSLGGDDGGSYVQLNAKYGDSRTIAAQTTFMDYFNRAGGRVNVFGTYDQWPRWSDYYAEQGLIDAGSYPIVEAIGDYRDGPQAIADGGILVPLSLAVSQYKILYLANSSTRQITSVGGWFVWMIYVPTDGDYDITVNVTASGSYGYALEVEGVEIDTATNSTSLAATVALTQGLYALKVRSTAGIVSVSSVVVVGDNAPSVPTVTSFAPAASSVALTWGAVSGATGYVLRYGTSPTALDSRVDVGNVLTASVTGLSSGVIMYFTVSAYNATGESLPSAIQSTIILADNTIGDLTYFEFQDYIQPDHSLPATHPAKVSAAQVTVSSISRAAGLQADPPWAWQFFPGRFISQPVSNTFATTIAGAVTANQFVQFTIAPNSGNKLTLTQIQYSPWAYTTTGFQTRLQYSVDGTNYFTVTPVAGTGGIYTADLSAIEALTRVETTITIRLIIIITDSYTPVGIGLGTTANDIIVRGKVQAPAGTFRRKYISYGGGKALLLQW